VFAFACLGLYALAGLLQWHLEARLNAASAALLLASAIFLLWTPLGVFVHIAGAVLLASIVIWQLRSLKR
jgi:TRAP-type uncharacterized transport system fused permease subunit